MKITRIRDGLCRSGGDTFMGPARLWGPSPCATDLASNTGEWETIGEYVRYPSVRIGSGYITVYWVAGPAEVGT